MSKQRIKYFKIPHRYFEPSKPLKTPYKYGFTLSKKPITEVILLQTWDDRNFLLMSSLMRAGYRTMGDWLVFDNLEQLNFELKQ